jgi:hypothetical protein
MFALLHSWISDIELDFEVAREIALNGVNSKINLLIMSLYSDKYTQVQPLTCKMFANKYNSFFFELSNWIHCTI